MWEFINYTKRRSNVVVRNSYIFYDVVPEAFCKKNER